MFYKNKNIRSNYSVMLGVFIFGAIVTGLCIWAAISGLISTKKTLDINVRHIDTVLQDTGNLAGKAVYFDITEPPILLAKAYKKTHYYLLTDGYEYRVAEIKKKDYEKIKSAVETSGSYRVQGLTEYIADNDRRNNVASQAKEYTGQDISVYSMDKILGEVCINNMKINFWNVYTHGIGLVAIIFGVIAVPVFLGGCSEMKSSRKVISLSKITAKDIDREACEKGSEWLEFLRIYLTGNMVIGIRSDSGTAYEGQVALKYSEVQRIYGYYKYGPSTGTDSPKKIERYIIEAIATDGNKYIISANKYGFDSDYFTGELNALYECIKKKNPEVLFEPEGTKYQTYKFSYIVETEDKEGALTAKLDESTKEMIIMHFDNSNLSRSFIPADAIVSMKMSIPSDGVVEITTGFFGDRASEVEPALYDFLKKELKVDRKDRTDEADDDYDDDDYEYSEYDEFGISFKTLKS